jgi:hypothetical protein
MKEYVLNDENPSKSLLNKNQNSIAAIPRYYSYKDLY